MASSENRDIADYCDHIVDATMMKTEFKKDKARTKSNFTRSRNKLQLLVEEQTLPSRTGVRDACQKMDTCVEIANGSASEVFGLLYQKKTTTEKQNRC